MPRYNRRGPRSTQAKGTLESLNTEGPYVEWVGRPPFYRHTLVIDAETYQYESLDADLGVTESDYVCFRFKQSGEKRTIDRNSLGKSIDPNSLNT